MGEAHPGSNAKGQRSGNDEPGTIWEDEDKAESQCWQTLTDGEEQWKL